MERIITKSESRASELVLRQRGYSKAWIYDQDDRSEVVFLIEPNEASLNSLDDVALELMAVVPHKKIWLARRRDDIRCIPLF